MYLGAEGRICHGMAGRKSPVAIPGVIIAGGGPAWMMCGSLLARAGVPMTVLEQHADFFRGFLRRYRPPIDHGNPRRCGLAHEVAAATAQSDRSCRERLKRQTTINPVAAEVAPVEDYRLANRAGEAKAIRGLQRQPVPAPPALGKEDMARLGLSRDRARCNQSVGPGQYFGQGWSGQGYLEPNIVRPTLSW